MAAVASLADLNPFDFPNEWSFITAAGQTSPGIIPVDGIRGFERETGWDKKKGKGAKGVTLSLVQQPPVEGEIEFHFWDRSQWAAWLNFLTVIKYQPDKAPGDRSAFDIHHPTLAALNISSCVTHKVSPWRHAGRKLYVAVLTLIEWAPPPPVSIVNTPKKSTADNPDKMPGIPTDPIADAQQKQIADLMTKLQTP